MLINDINVLRNYIDENIRNTAISGIPYLDLNGNKTTILAKQNTVVFGRRGSGKSTLLAEIKKEKKYVIDINLENYKNISFPNVIIKVLEQIIKSIQNQLLGDKFYLFKSKKRKLNKDFKRILESLKELFEEDDSYESDIEKRTQEEIESGGNADIKTTAGNSGLYTKIKGIEENKIQRKKQFLKLEKLRKNLVDYKNLFDTSSKIIYNDEPIYILLDDFYFIDIDNQPYLIDILHVLTKGNQFFLKIASRKQKSKLYISDGSTFQGIEIGHDATEVDLDYSLENMDNLIKFFKLLLNSIFQKIKINIQLDQIITDDAFNQLCIASGGVTRDFLTILSKCLSYLFVESNDECNNRITKENVNAQAISNLSSKIQSLTTDKDNKNNRVELCLDYIKDEILTKKRTNCFLISKSDLESFPQEKNIIQLLFDLRFIHLIEKSTSCAPSDKKMYEAYILDVGLYTFVRLRDFKQIEPNSFDKRSRRDDMRSSPKINLSDLTQFCSL